MLMDMGGGCCMYVSESRCQYISHFPHQHGAALIYTYSYEEVSGMLQSLVDEGAHIEREEDVLHRYVPRFNILHSLSHGS